LTNTLPPPVRAPKSPSLAALLSFLWPGLGQAYAGHRLAALLFTVPFVGLIGALAYNLQDGIKVVVARLLDPQFAFLVLIAIVGLGIWRLLAVLNAYGGADTRLVGRAGERFALVLLLVAIVATHAGGAYFLWSTYTMDTEIFGGGQNDPVEPGMAPVTNDRVTIMLAGLDEYSTRSESLFDSIMVVSLDKTSHRIAMISVPRDTSAFPYYFGGTSKIKINALPTYVRNGWVKSGDQPVTTLIKEVSYLVGIPINYYAIMDLASFSKMIDMVGGIDITVPNAIVDPTYDWLDHSTAGFSISAGKHHMSGRIALAYVRSRHGSGNSDWQRAGRQQQLLVALEQKMASPTMLLKLPSLTSQAASLVHTNFPADQVDDMVKEADAVPDTSYDRVVLGPPYSVGGTTNGAYTSCLKLDKVAEISVKFFGKDSAYSGKTQKPTC
jgi:polyisoprenyl-teichoic acid--peptidoglycan teichoic acid transferase